MPGKKIGLFAIEYNNVSVTVSKKEKEILDSNSFSLYVKKKIKMPFIEACTQHKTKDTRSIIIMSPNLNLRGKIDWEHARSSFPCL